MRLLSGIFLIVALLAAVLWLTVGALASVAKVVMLLFLAIFIVSLFLKRRHPEEL